MITNKVAVNERHFEGIVEGRDMSTICRPEPKHSNIVVCPTNLLLLIYPLERGIHRNYGEAGP